MYQKAYHIISGTIFGIVAVLHLLRLIFHSELMISSHVIPMWLSYGGFIAAGFLSIWSFKSI